MPTERVSGAAAGAANAVTGASDDGDAVDGAAGASGSLGGGRGGSGGKEIGAVRTGRVDGGADVWGEEVGLGAGAIGTGPAMWERIGGRVFVLFGTNEVHALATGKQTWDEQECVFSSGTRVDCTVLRSHWCVILTRGGSSQLALRRAVSCAAMEMR